MAGAPFHIFPGSRRFGRRALLGVPAVLFARPGAAADAIPAVPVLVRSAIDPVPTGFVDEQLNAAGALFESPALRFAEAAPRRTIPATHAKIETREDRDALAKYWIRGVVNVFVVESLRDVDDVSRLRKGVTWRCLDALHKKYVVVASYSPPQVLAHELGHFFSLGHSSVKNNLMSYSREEGKPIVLDDAQARAVRSAARALFANGDLAAEPRLWKNLVPKAAE